LKDLADTDLGLLLIYASEPYANLVRDVDIDFFNETEEA